MDAHPAFFSPFAIYVYFYSLVASFDLSKFQEFVRTILVKNPDARIVVVGTALDIKDRTVPTFHLQHLETDKLVRCCENICIFLGTRYGYNAYTCFFLYDQQIAPRVVNKSLIWLSNFVKKADVADDMPLLQETLKDAILQAQEEFAMSRSVTVPRLLEVWTWYARDVQQWARDMLAGRRVPMCTVAEFQERLNVPEPTLGLVLDVLVNSDVVAVFIGGDTSFVFLDAHWTRCMVGQLFSVTPAVANRRPASLDHRRLLKEDDRVLQNVWLDKTGYAGFPRTELLRIVTMVDLAFDLGGLGLTVVPRCEGAWYFVREASPDASLGPLVSGQSEVRLQFRWSMRLQGFLSIVMTKWSAFIVPQAMCLNSVVLAWCGTRAFVHVKGSSIRDTPTEFTVLCRGPRAFTFASSIYWAVVDVMCAKFPYYALGPAALARIWCPNCEAFKVPVGSDLRCSLSRCSYRVPCDADVFATRPTSDGDAAPEDGLTVPLTSVNLTSECFALVIATSSHDALECGREVAIRLRDAGVSASRTIVALGVKLEEFLDALQRFMKLINGARDCHALVYFAGYGMCESGMEGVDTLLTWGPEPGKLVDLRHVHVCSSMFHVYFFLLRRRRVHDRTMLGVEFGDEHHWLGHGQRNGCSVCRLVQRCLEQV